MLCISARHHQHDNFETEPNINPGLNYRPRMYGNAFHPGRFFQGKGVDGSTHHRRYPGAFGPASRNSYLTHGESQVPLKPKVITIVRNGPKPRNNVKILLNRRSVQSFEQLMGDISEAFGPKWKANKVRKLFTTRGREVQGVADFFRDDDVFIGVGNEPLTETDVHDIIEEVYPDSPYAKNIMKDFERHKRKRLAQGKDAVRDNDADKRDSGFGEGSDGSARDPPEEFVLYKGRQVDKSRRRNEYPRDMEMANRLDRDKEKAAQEEKDRARKQREKVRDTERRAVEEENRKKRQVPREKPDDPLKRLKEQKEKEREEIRRRREEERQQKEEEDRQRREDEKQRREEERQRKEKDRQEREQAEIAARERQAVAERERKEKEKERRAAKEKEQREKELREKEAAAKEREKHEKEKQEKEKENKEKEAEKEADNDKDHHDDKSDRTKADKTEKEKDNREVEKRKKKTNKSRIVRKSKLERQISSDDHVLAKYELGATLGDGNFAIVRMSKLKATGTQYAMKVIDKPKLKGKEHMVENEIEIMKDCNHPNIVKLYEEYETADKIFLVMELVKVRRLT